MNQDIVYYSVQDATPDPFPDKPVGYPKAWSEANLKEQDYLFPIPRECIQELNAVASILREAPVPTLMLTPGMFELDACRAFMGRVKCALDEGVGHAVLDRLPMEEYDDEEATAIYWLLGSLMASPAAQKWNGQMIHHVTDRGLTGENSEQSTAGLKIHTDGPHALTPPQYVGLLCLQRAMEGGKSVVISWNTVFNELLNSDPDLLKRGFRAFLIQRPERSRAPDSPPVMSKPLLFYDGGLRMHYSSHKPREGYRVAGVPLDEEGRRFLAAVDETLSRKELRAEYYLERGQIQFLNNSAVGHERTPYADAPDPDKKRHMIRVYFREQGRISYDG
ncbi:MAG: TauD/TfdA family dioxygenase [SAR324 cluster bacterium]|nr:TauD/TfdA family dioxygenase [SAR324 cluster bacterium]